ncbi:hypothetical protein Tco_0621710 [Tanacetum coccineum]
MWRRKGNSVGVNLAGSGDRVLKKMYSVLGSNLKFGKWQERPLKVYRCMAFIVLVVIQLWSLEFINVCTVYEAEIKGQSSSSSNSQNVAFVSSENTSSTNEEVNVPHEVSTASSQGQASSLTYADDIMFSFFANQSNSPQLDNEDLE